MTSASVARTRPASGPGVIAAAFLLVGALALAGCGGSVATAAPATAGPEASSAPTAPTDAASTDPGSGAGSDCGGETAALVQKGLTSPAVIRVSVEGGCHDAWVETTLDKSTVGEALTICDAASRIAYGPDISSITVTGKEDVELAIGIMGQDCIGEP